MIVSWNWLKQYVLLDMPVGELERRLMLAGLNHESTQAVDGDFAIDLEVTSNRPDCLGHLGIAREVAALWQRPLMRSSAEPAAKGPPIAKLTRVRIDCPDLCYRYTARIVRGAKIGPSPDWMTRRLKTVGIAAINNVVDISNYVMLECGQPLHTFDFGKLRGSEIIVRRPRAGETIEAIDHRVYELPADACVIADAADAVAIGGVMGGARTEISHATREVLVEAAEFNALSIRNTARKLSLHSDSSYRFERKVDPAGLDWASRRCCELILELCGGELAEGVIDVGAPRAPRTAVVLRFSQLRRVLGIDVPAERVREILTALGGVETPMPAERKVASDAAICILPPSWRRDLTREIDLVEEVGRIYGYDAISEDVGVPMVPSSRTREDQVLDKLRQTLVGCGCDEAMTISMVDEATAESLSPWTAEPPLRTQMPVLRGADCLRRTLVPSLLQARQTNQGLANPVIELFEIAKVYLPTAGGLPREERMLAVASGRSYAEIKGVCEALVAALHIAAPLTADAVAPYAAGDAAPRADLAPRLVGQGALDAAAACRLLLGGETIGYVGRVSAELAKRFSLRGETVVAELRLAPLLAAAVLAPQYLPLSLYPSVNRDVNLVVEEAVRWADVAEAVRAACGPRLESLSYCDTYRDAARLGEGKKSLLFTLTLRSREGTLTSTEADAVRDAALDACRRQFAAQLRA